MVAPPCSPAARVALIHALEASLGPTADAFARVWPSARLINLLDDSLSRDRADLGMTDAIRDRCLALACYARDLGVDAILFTCSAFGPAIQHTARQLAPLPVHPPNAAAIAGVTATAARIGLLATFPPTLESMKAEFPAGVGLVLKACPQALEALGRGEGAVHDQLAAAAAREAFADCDAILLSQFSLARAANAVAAATGKAVFTTPDWAVRALQRAVAGCPSRG